MLGYVAVSYSVGFTVGPAVGGLLSAVSLQFAAWVATLGSLLSLATVLLMLPGAGDCTPREGRVWAQQLLLLLVGAGR